MNLNKLVLLLLSIGLLGCTSGNAGDQEKVALKLYIFDVGEILVNDISQMGAGAEAIAPVRMTNSAFLIRHPKGDLIWDTGFPDSVVNHPLGTPEDAYYSTMSKSLESQLNELKLKPSDIEYLAVSHLHPDHSGNMGLFTKATVLLQKEEYASLFEEGPNPNVEAIRNNPAQKLEGDLDVFGDGSVVIMRTPGHTAGHQVLFVDLPETGPIVLSGDLFLFAKDRESREVPGFNVNKELTEASWLQIEAFVKKQGAQLWVQHDHEQMMAMPHSPQVIK